MKTNLNTILAGVTCGLVLGLASASAVSYTSGTLDTTIPDGSSVGIASVINVAGAGAILNSGDNVSVTLNVSGGNMGDLYGYLSFDGQTVVLLNRPGLAGDPSGLGYAGGSLNVTLFDGGSYASIDSYISGVGGSATGNYNPSAGPTAFQAFNNTSANGDWTLFIADLSGGDGGNASTLNSWSVGITAVPEPVNTALGIFGGVAGVIGAIRWWLRRKRSG